MILNYSTIQFLLRVLPLSKLLLKILNPQAQVLIGRGSAEIIVISIVLGCRSTKVREGRRAMITSGRSRAFGTGRYSIVLIQLVFYQSYPVLNIFKFVAEIGHHAIDRVQYFFA